LLLVSQGTYFGEIISGGTHNPLPPFEAFLVGFFMVGWGTGLHGDSVGIASLGEFHCLQTLKKSISSVKG